MRGRGEDGSSRRADEVGAFTWIPLPRLDVLIPLQFGVPGGPELFIILIIFLIPGVLVGRWIYRDASKRGSDWAWQWAVGIVFLFLAGLVPGLLGVIIYLLVRSDEVA